MCLVLYTYIFKYVYMCWFSICEKNFEEVGGIKNPMKITLNPRTPMMEGTRM